MTRAAAQPPVRLHGQVGRADLLRRLAVDVGSATAEPIEHLAVDTSDGWFGYVWCEPPSSPSDADSREEVSTSGGATVPTPPTRYRLPRRVESMRAITLRESREGAVARTAPREPTEAPLVEDAAWDVDGPEELPHRPIVPRSRVVPALRRQLSAITMGAIDLRRLAADLCERRPLRRLPRRRTTRWSTQVVVVLDMSQRLLPYREDMHELAQILLEECGKSATSLRAFFDGPHGGWSELRDAWARRLVRQRPWTPPAAGTAVLLATDLGLLRGPLSEECRSWQSFVRGLVQAGCPPVALAPLGARQVEGDLFPGLRLLRWSPDSTIRAERGRAARHDGASAPEGLDKLLGMVATLVRVDPRLLRAMRGLLPTAGRNAGLEGALWHHADVRCGAAAEMRTSEARARHLETFKAMDVLLQSSVAAEAERDHRHLRGLTVADEVLRLAGHPVDGTVSDEVVDRARMLLRRLRATVRARPDAEWLRVAKELLARADRETVDAHGDLYFDLQDEVARAVAARGGVVRPPEWQDPIEADEGVAGETRQMHLVEGREGSLVLLQAEPAGAGQLPLGPPMVVDGRGVRMRVIDAAGRPGRWRSGRAGGALTVALPSGMALEVVSARERLVVGTVQRPRGALEWGRSARGVFVRTPALGPAQAKWEQQPDWDGPRRTLGMSKPRLESAPALCLIARSNKTTALSSVATVDFSIDALAGVLAIVRFTTAHGSATQTFRWIEPGDFMMGSPESEAERVPHEGPQHRVVLTRGFWLADTACTQRLWTAVMGSNPSRFKGDDRPVEQVSWDDVQEFLSKLEGLLPGCGASLPTEAEWEYACRAGTTTPFSFGENITPEEVNYNGNSPYAGGRKGAYRHETVPVKSLPANGWGLHEMHGNVWEWCRDGKRTYEAEESVDPVGPEGARAPFRVVSGGSWHLGARRARSAYRNARGPGIRNGDIGFRLSLRSMGSSQERSAEQTQSGSARGAGPRPHGGRPAEPGGRGAPSGGFLERLGRTFGLGGGEHEKDR